MNYAEVFDLAKECMCLDDAIGTIEIRIRDEEFTDEFAFNHAMNADEEWEAITFKTQKAKEMLLAALKLELQNKTDELKSAASR